MSGRRLGACAALAHDGRVIAAASEEVLARDGSAVGVGFPAASVAACLERARLGVGDVDRVVVVSGGTPGAARSGRLRRPAGAARSDWLSKPVDVIDSQTADALQFGAGGTAAVRLVMVLDTDGDRDGAVFSAGPDHRLRFLEPVVGWAAVVRAARILAAALGLEGGLTEALSFQASFVPNRPEGMGVGAFVSWRDDKGFSVDEDAVRSSLERSGASASSGASGQDLLNVRALEARRELAAAFQRAVVDGLVAMVRRQRERHGVAETGLAGSLLANSWMAAGLVDQLGDGVKLAPLPDVEGRAIGASLLHEFDQEAPRGLALGPAFTEQEVKNALDGARLDYVYEPDWEKLLRRVSALLVRGKTVAWFQGPMDFGPRLLGGRSVLADPSDKFARDSVLKYLKRTSPDAEGLSLSLRDCDADECLLVPIRSPHTLLRGTVVESWRNRLRAVLDHQNSCRVHTVSSDSPSGLWDLLRVHRDRWGGAGLVNTTLAAGGEPTACTPRDALKVFYSSAIDALAIGRFLLMKDYWLLRSDVDR